MERLLHGAASALRPMEGRAPVLRLLTPPAQADPSLPNTQEEFTQESYVDAPANLDFTGRNHKEWKQFGEKVKHRLFE